MFCPNCGKQLPDDSLFCSECGTTLRAAGSTPQMRQPTTVQQPTTAQQPAKPVQQPSVPQDQKQAVQAQKPLPVKTIAIVAAAAVLIIIVGSKVLGGIGSKDTQTDDVPKPAASDAANKETDSPDHAVSTAQGTAEPEKKSEETSVSTDKGQDATDSVGSVEVHWMNAGAAENPGPLYNQLTQDEKEIYDLMAEHFEHGEYKRAELQKYPSKNAADKNAYDRAAEAFSNDYPRVGTPRYYAYFDIRPNTTANAEFSAVFEDRRDFISDQDAIGGEVAKVTATLSGTTSEKVKQINDYLKDRVIYDEAKKDAIESDVENNGGVTVDLSSTTQDIQHMAYGALVEQSAVCDGYAYAFAAICQEAGIPCYVIIGKAGDHPGEGISHAWNTVQLEDGNWYEIDVTWNDAYSEDRWFCLPTSQMEQDHMRKCVFQDIIPVTAGDTGERSVAPLEFSELDWFVKDDFDASYPPDGAMPVTDAGDLKGDWKMLIKEDPADSEFLFEYLHVNLSLKLNGTAVTGEARWYNGFSADVISKQPFSTYMRDDSDPVSLTGTCDTDQMVITLSDEEHSGNDLQSISDTKRIKTLRLEDFYIKDDKIHGVGYVYDEDGKTVARVLIMKNR